MSSEITINPTFIMNRGKLYDTFQPGQLQFDCSDERCDRQVISVGTSEADVTLANTSGSEGWCVMRNLDSTNYVTYGPKSAGAMVAFGKMKAGEIAMLRLSAGLTLRWQANTAAVKVDIRVYRD